MKNPDIELDRNVDGRTLREIHTRFAGHFVESRNPMQAYRLAFAPSKSMASQLIHDRAVEALKHPHVQALVQELRDLAASETIVTIRQLIEDWNDIATADPNELTSVAIDACRFCWGVEHRYQYVDDAEYADACDMVMRSNAKMKPDVTPTPLPDFTGGIGFNPTQGAAFDCPACYGRGRPHTLIHDTRKVSPAARKLFAGVKMTAHGPEVIMHDQLKAREQLGRVLGAFKDGLVLSTSAPLSGRAADKPVTVDDAARSYLQLVSSK